MGNQTRVDGVVSSAGSSAFSKTSLNIRKFTVHTLLKPGLEPRGATPRPRSGAEAGRTPCPKGGGQEELPYVRGQGQRPRVPGCDGTETAERSYPASEFRGGDERSYPESEVRGGGREELPHAPTPEARGGGWEDQPYLQEAVAVRAQENLEELSHVEGQEGRW